MGSCASSVQLIEIVCKKCKGTQIGRITQKNKNGNKFVKNSEKEENRKLTSQPRKYDCIRNQIQQRRPVVIPSTNFVYKMAGNFWQSSHYQQWILDKQDLIRERHHDLLVLTEEEYQKIFIFFSNFIQVLGEQLKLRQQVIATATVYFKRFYARNSLKCIDPLLLAPTCIFLASKVEEFGVISNTRLITTCQNVVKNKFSYAYTQEFPYRTNHILECEFYLLENLDCCLILYQPYRPLLSLIADIGNGHEDQMMALAWRVVNDSLRTDVCLLYPPYQIALGCLQIACVILQKDLKTWFAELNVDMEKIQEIARHLINLFELWKSYDEKKEIPGLLAKMPKPKTQPSR